MEGKRLPVLGRFAMVGQGKPAPAVSADLSPCNCLATIYVIHPVELDHESAQWALSHQTTTPCSRSITFVFSYLPGIILGLLTGKLVSHCGKIAWRVFPGNLFFRSGIIGGLPHAKL